MLAYRFRSHADKQVQKVPGRGLLPVSGRFLKLTVVKLRVEALLFQKLLMGSLLDDIAILHDKDQICVPDG